MADRVVSVEGVRAVLASGISATATSFTVEPISGLEDFPSSGFQVQIDSEVILIGARSGTVFSSLTRGQEGTVAYSHPARAGVFYVVGGEKILEGGNGGSQPYGQTIVNIDETAGAGTYTASVPVTAGTRVIECVVYSLGLWDADTTLLEVSDAAGGEAAYIYLDVKGTLTDIYDPASLGGQGGSGWTSAASAGSTYDHQLKVDDDGAGSPVVGVIYASDDTILVSFVTTGAGGTSGKTQIRLSGWQVPNQTITAVKS